MRPLHGTVVSFSIPGAADRLREVQEQLKVAQAKMSESMSAALKKKEEVRKFT